jgi:Ecdysteroid kinase-like family
LNHFLYTSCNRDVHENHIDDLIKFYSEELAAALSKLNYPKIPTYEVIRGEFARKADQGLIALCSIVPVMMIDNPDHANPENFIADGDGAAAIRRDVYGNPAFVEVLRFLLPKLAEKKVF